jgi:hypothetical protein
MDYFAAIDVPVELSSVCVVDSTGKIVHERKVGSDPEALVAHRIKCRDRLHAVRRYARCLEVRSLARLMDQLISSVEELKERDIGFRSLTEAIDTTNAAGELFFRIFGVLAQLERSITRERTKADEKNCGPGNNPAGLSSTR